MPDKYKTLKVLFPVRLLEELQNASAECGLSPAAFCAESCEGVLASRRMAARVDIKDSFAEPAEDVLVVE